MDTLFDIARSNERVVLLTGDLGFGVVTQFAKELPKQFLNVGIAEPNMTGLATGLALGGKTVVTYSIANFPTLRCIEQIRNDVCYHDADVKIVSVGGGMAYGSLGVSHHATEDIAMMRAIPKLDVVAPNDPHEAECATRAVLASGRPTYLRLGRAGEPRVHDKTVPFTLGKAIRVREGTDVALLVTGGLLQEALRAADVLEARGLGVRVISVHTIVPLDETEVRAAGRECDAVFTVEEHSVVGGLGGAVSECLLESGAVPRTFRRIGIRGGFTTLVGDQAFLREQYGLDAAGIVRTVNEALSMTASA